jgi:2-polyprenyl-3-methyl-5-hydroxy-6-metoxy-1,4-benzoquinol methylase
MDKERIKSFSDRIFADMAGAMTAGLGYVGVKTGLFQAMEGKGPLTLERVVEASGLQSRYVEEWLKGMACTGYLDHDPGTGTYQLPAEHAFLLCSEGTDHFMGGLFGVAPALLRFAPRVAEAFKKGGGVPFEDYGADCIEAFDRVNRGQYEQRFAGYWLGFLPEVVERLKTGGSVLDVGCGVGRVVLTLAKAFPGAIIAGVDTDGGSIESAREAAEREGLGGRARFTAGTPGDIEPAEKFDLVTACDCIHDMTDPVKTLVDIRARLKPDGVLFIVEPRVSDRLEENRNPMATMFYGFSVFHCMTQSLARGGAGLGTCMGPARLKALLLDAGFTRIDTPDIKSQSFSFCAVRI